MDNYLSVEDKNVALMEYVKSTELKGKVQIISDYEFLWDLGGIFLRFLFDDQEAMIIYSRRKSNYFEIGHFHEDCCNLINLIKDINSADKRVHIAVLFYIFGSSFRIENKAKKKKKSWLIVNHYYSEL